MVSGYMIYDDVKERWCGRGLLSSTPPKVWKTLGHARSAITTACGYVNQKADPRRFIIHAGVVVTTGIGHLAQAPNGTIIVDTGDEKCM